MISEQRWIYEQRVLAMARGLAYRRTVEDVAEYFGESQGFVINAVRSSVAKSRIRYLEKFWNKTFTLREIACEASSLAGRKSNLLWSP